MGWYGLDWSGLGLGQVESSFEYGFYKMLGNYQVATQLVASPVVLSFVQLVSELVVPFGPKLKQ
jgi:hypothetical protein